MASRLVTFVNMTDAKNEIEKNRRGLKLGIVAAIVLNLLFSILLMSHQSSIVDRGITVPTPIYSESLSDHGRTFYMTETESYMHILFLILMVISFVCTMPILFAWALTHPRAAEMGLKL
jgi:hypothetical protein